MATEYYVTDGRPLTRALVMVTCDSFREALRERPDYGPDAQIWKVVDGASEADWVLVHGGAQAGPEGE